MRIIAFYLSATMQTNTNTYFIIHFFHPYIVHTIIAITQAKKITLVHHKRKEKPSSLVIIVSCIQITFIMQNPTTDNTAILQNIAKQIIKELRVIYTHLTNTNSSISIR